MILRIRDLLDSRDCFNRVREMRWPEGRTCPFCDSHRVICKRFDEKHHGKQRYQCKSCSKRFDDLTGTIFSGCHQPIEVWILASYFMGLNLSNSQIAKELDFNLSDTQCVVKKPLKTSKMKSLTDSLNLLSASIMSGY